jgi:hypothetical protein
MRILRGLSSRTLRCGCTAGVYETYSGQVVTVIDATGRGCSAQDHRAGATLSADAVEELRPATEPPIRA